ncbi:RES family NAD+ phosphorylase [Mycolicibacterium fluoranthenivorans]|uniref:RES family NAD+ phosphorylase n=1 Tax=Mycolicibacterium fluoranthenivorans TaxID=258505 RepID=UPI0038B3C4D9
MSDAPTLPDPPSPDELRVVGVRNDEVRVIAPAQIWWRVHRTEGAHVLGWNEFRHYGPVLRFDPHPPPTAEHPDVAVWYGASTPGAALAEAFQVDRTIDRRRGRPYLTGLSFTRALSVLDLAADSRGAWATRAGGTFAMSTAPHRVTQRWARAIVQAFPDLGGVRYNSRFAGDPCLALFAPAREAMPRQPVASLALTHPALGNRLAGAAHRIGYRVI